MKRLIFFCLTLFLIFISLPASAQQKQKFSVANFEYNPFDMAAQSAKLDGSGNRYAIIKVSSTNPDDDLKEYTFNFGNLRSFVEEHDNELWVYVQKNAKTVTISHPGYTTIQRYDLKTTIESGKTYAMTLSTKGRVIYTQMVQFNVNPNNSGAVVTIKSSKPNAQDEVIGTIDATGSIAKSLEFGTYTYKVMAANYYTSEGRFTLNDRSKTHIENISLRTNYAEITLQVNDDAEIWVNGENKATRMWKGKLKSGDYQVECRKVNHETTSQSITVVDNVNATINLKAPLAYTGTLAITSNPLGASILIDGKDFGVTPKNVNDIQAGIHSLLLKLKDYADYSQSFDIKRDETTNVDVALERTKKAKKIKPVEGENKEVKSTSNSLIKENGVYFQAFGQAGTMTGFGGAIGGYFKNFNVEAFIVKPLGSETFYINSYVGSYNYKTVDTSGLFLGGKVGYGINVAKKFRITPQIGAGSLKMSDLSNVLSATIGIQVEYFISSNFGISLNPEANFAVKKDDNFEQVSALSSKMKGWGNGFNARLGLFVCF